MTTERLWTEVLPEAWHGNPNVVVVTISPKGKSRVMVKADGTMLGVLEQTAPTGEKVYHGLQVIAPELKTYVAHEEMFKRAGILMVQPRYIGPLVGVPQALLTGDLMPLAFMRDKMWFPYLDIVGYMRTRHPDYEKNDTLC